MQLISRHQFYLHNWHQAQQAWPRCLKVPGASAITSLLQSGQGLTSEIQGAARLLESAKNLPGVTSLLKDIPGSGEILSSFNEFGPELFTQGLDALGLDAANLGALGLDVSALTDFGAADLLAGSEKAIEAAQEYAAEAFEAVASFW